MDREKWMIEIKKALVEKRMDLKQLADAVGYSYAHITNALAPSAMKAEPSESQRFINAVSDFCGVEPYVKEKKNDKSCTCGGDDCDNCDNAHTARR